MKECDVTTLPQAQPNVRPIEQGEVDTWTIDDLCRTAANEAAKQSTKARDIKLLSF